MIDHHRRPGERTSPAPGPSKTATPDAPTAAEVCRLYRPSGGAKGLLRDDQTADAFADALVARGLAADAVEFQAHRLPGREAVWWGCLCAWEVARPAPAGAEDEAFRAAVRWVLDPDEPNRQAAGRAGDVAGFQVPAGLLARAASWSGGSLAPPGLPAVAPPPELPARAVVAALRLASARDPGASLLRFARMAADVAAGMLPWDV